MTTTLRTHKRIFHPTYEVRVAAGRYGWIAVGLKPVDSYGKAVSQAKQAATYLGKATTIFSTTMAELGMTFFPEAE